MLLQVTTLLGKAEETSSTAEVTDEALVELDTGVSQQGSAVKAAKEASPVLCCCASSCTLLPFIY